MGIYSVRGFTGATSGFAGEPVFALWNPDAAQRLKVHEIGFYKGGLVGERFILQRTTARGTGGSTVTPGATNAWDVEDGPPAGAVLDLGVFASNPTFGTPAVHGVNLGIGTGSGGTGMVWTFPRPFWIKPGSGLACVSVLSTDYPTSEVYFVWEEN